MPTFELENQYGGIVAGVDEVGRGPLAGPVVAAAVILHDRDVCPAGIDDSKKLSPKKRAQLFDTIMSIADVGVGMASVEEIDRINILQASKLAMVRAVQNLQRFVPQVILVDGNQPIQCNGKIVTVVKGDSLSLSIAAASIIAKVTRDRMMEKLHEEFPHYDWINNAGYGAPKHLEGMKRFGVTAHHRRSFAPVRVILETKEATNA